MKPFVLCAVAFSTVAMLADPYSLDRCVAAPNAGTSLRLAGSREAGSRLVVTGRVVDQNEKPVAGVFVRAFQADAGGRYSNETRSPVTPRLCGVLRTDAAGVYAFDTIRPGSYPGTREPQHIHFMVFGSGIAEQRLLLRFADDPFVGAQTSSDRTSVVRPIAKRAGIDTCERDLKIRR